MGCNSNFYYKIETFIFFGYSKLFRVEMAKDKTCTVCDCKMVVIDKKVIGDTEYEIFKCEKCKHIVAKSVD